MQWSKAQDYLIVNHSFYASHLLDSSLKLVHTYNAPCGVCGGGNGHFSYDEKYYSGTMRTFSDTEDTVWLTGITTGDKKPMVWKQYASNTPFRTKPQYLVGKYGKYWVYNYETEKLKTLPINLATEEEPRPWTDMILVQNDEMAIICTETYGLQLYDTKKWKLRKTIDGDLASCSNLKLSADGQYYSYTSDDVAFIRNTKDHRVVFELKTKTKHLMDFDYSADLTFCMYIGKKRNVYYHDMKTGATKTLLSREEYLEFSGLIIHPKGKSFMTGVNGNRVLDYKLFTSGVAPQNIKKVQVFEYTLEEAKKIDSKQMKLELALKSKGYEVVLDNRISDEDRALWEYFCVENGFDSIRSDEAQKFLGLYEETKD